MIPRKYIQEWKATTLWPLDSQVEQDLVICRALTEIYSNEFLASKLAFRGGTALYKLYMTNQPRYSEDIDLVQIPAGPIKDIFNRLRQVLQFLGEPSIKQKGNNNTALFHFDSEVPPIVRLKLKVETNCREHFSEMGYCKIPFTVNSEWFTGSCSINTYHLDELIGTKLRALYQRKKGRDLYDIYKALLSKLINPQNVLKCYRKYMLASVKKPPSEKEFLLNLEEKMTELEFLTDTEGLLRPGEKYNPAEAFKLIKIKLIEGM